jgi:hypothetical protein
MLIIAGVLSMAQGEKLREKRIRKLLEGPSGAAAENGSGDDV